MNIKKGAKNIVYSLIGQVIALGLGIFVPRLIIISYGSEVNGLLTSVSQVITYLGSVLPYAIIGMLVVYCFKGVSVVSYPYGLPELIAAAFVVGMHVWRRNTLISVFGGVAVYMALVQLVF